jgi:hypothetical protein
MGPVGCRPSHALLSMVRMRKIAVGHGEDPGSLKKRCAIFCKAIIRLAFSY